MRCVRGRFSRITSAWRSAVAARMERRYVPQIRSVTLINTGDGRAIFSYSGVVVTARWVMALKDRIDRRFMRRFQLGGGTGKPGAP